MAARAKAGLCNGVGSTCNDTGSIKMKRDKMELHLQTGVSPNPHVGNGCNESMKPPICLGTGQNVLNFKSS